MAGRVLLIGDDRDRLLPVGEALERAGQIVLHADTAAEGVRTCERELPDVVVLDLRVSDGSGITALERMVLQHTPVIALAAPGDESTAERAVQLGAEHCDVLPIAAPRLQMMVGRALERVRLEREVRLLRAGVRVARGGESLGVSLEMRDLEAGIRAAAQHDGTAVLITGAHGTGKGRVARLVHQLSPRADGPFVEAKCGGRAETLDASALFGRATSATPGGDTATRGLLETAGGGTLFLDEIGDLVPALQPMLHEALSAGRFRRVGGTSEIGADARLIAASSRELLRGVGDGTFHKDLHDRLAAVQVVLPRVRERGREDRVHLVRSIVAELAEEVPGAPVGLTDDALHRVLRYPWPGNVREMRNALEHAMIRARGASAIRPRHLPVDVCRDPEHPRRARVSSLKESERRVIERALRHHEGNRTHAAADLGISRVTLLKKIKEFGIDA